MRESDSLQHRLSKLGLTWKEVGREEEFALLRDSEDFGSPDRAMAAVLASHLSELEELFRGSSFIEPLATEGLSAGRHLVVVTAGDLAVRVNFLNSGNSITHLCVAGSSGFGKSCLMAQLASEAASECHTLLIDGNRFFRSVPAMLQHHRFVRLGDLRVNLWDGHEGVSVGVSDQLVHHSICDSYSLQFAEYEIAEVVAELREVGLPNLPAVIERLKLKNFRGNTNRGRYRDSAVLVLGNLLAATGEVFRCAKGMDLFELLHGNSVLEVDGLLPEHQAFLVRFLTTYVHLEALSR